jgi:hypothetical protein
MSTHTNTGFTDLLGGPSALAPRRELPAIPARENGAGDDRRRRRVAVLAALVASSIAVVTVLGLGAQTDDPAPQPQPDVLQQLVNQGLVPRQALDPARPATGGDRRLDEAELTRRLIKLGLIPTPHQQ